MCCMRAIGTIRKGRDIYIVPGHGVKELLYLRMGWIVGTFGIPSLEGLFILLGSYGMYLFNGIDKMYLVIISSGETVFVGCETM